MPISPCQRFVHTCKSCPVAWSCCCRRSYTWLNWCWLPLLQTLSVSDHSVQCGGRNLIWKVRWDNNGWITSCCSTSKTHTNKLDLITVANEFVDSSETRLARFGRFHDTDRQRKNVPVKSKSVQVSTIKFWLLCWFYWFCVYIFLCYIFVFIFQELTFLIQILRFFDKIPLNLCIY